MYPRDYDKLENFKDSFLSFFDKDLEEDYEINSSTSKFSNIDFYDYDTKIAYELSLPVFLDWLSSEKHVESFVKDLMKKISVYKSLQSNNINNISKVVWVFPSASETIFQILEDNNIDYLLLSETS